MGPLSRVALFGDVHGNLPALERVLRHARARGAQAFWDLGDLTGYGPFPEEVVCKVAEVADRSVLGNYDRKVLRVEEKLRDWKGRKDPEKLLAFTWAREQLSEESVRFLRSLPRELVFREDGLAFFLTHASPGSWKEHLNADTPRERFGEIAVRTGADVICTAHTHRPFALREGGAWFVNPGSVGRPEGGDPRAVYAMLDFEGGRFGVTHYRLDYDRERTAGEVRRRELPGRFARMFREGVSLEGSRAAEGAAGGASYSRDELITAARDLSIQCVPLDQGHFLQVTRLALRLFDYLRPLHRRGDDERVQLQAAALLHDIGWADGQRGHHKSSMRRILDAAELPMDERERKIVALIARYHRRALPREKHPYFRDLESEDRRRVRELGCLLRIADGLDYSHDSGVEDLEVQVLDHSVRVICRSRHLMRRDIERAMDKGGECFKSLFNRELIILWHHI